jgi:N-acyl-D-aspartate/D-glutamate deacylase
MPYDLVIRNGTVIDGSGLPRYRAADLVVFDPDTIAAEMPEVVDGLPAGARRLIQRTRGIAARS